MGAEFTYLQKDIGFHCFFPRQLGKVIKSSDPPQRDHDSDVIQQN